MSGNERKQERTRGLKVEAMKQWLATRILLPRCIAFWAATLVVAEVLQPIPYRFIVRPGDAADRWEHFDFLPIAGPLPYDLGSVSGGSVWRRAICGGRDLLLYEKPSAAGAASARQAGDRMFDREALQALLYAYFQEADAKLRRELAERAAEAAGRDPFLAARELSELNLWRKLPRRGTIVSAGHSRFCRQLAYALPEDYDPARPHPAVLVIPEIGAEAAAAIDRGREILGARSRQLVFLACSGDRPSDRPAFADESLDVAPVLREARRRIHLDTRRVFLMGERTGGDLAWILILRNPQEFAGAIFVSSFPRLPYAEQMLPLLLENLEDRIVLNAWYAPGAEPVHVRASIVAAYGRALKRFARQASLSLWGVELPPGGKELPAEFVERVLLHRRPAVPHAVNHWFRFPADGRAGWIELSASEGEVWRDDQISIVSGADQPRGEFIKEVLTSLMGRLQGRIEGNDIHLSTRRASGIRVFLPLDGFDFSQPIRVYGNGLRRHHRVKQPAIAAMLETAYARWDTAHPVAAVIELSLAPPP